MGAIKQENTGINLKGLTPNSSLAQRSLKPRGVKAEKVGTLQTSTFSTSPQAEVQGIQQVGRAKSGATQDLATRLSQFSNFQLQQGNAGMEREARAKATQDVLSGEKVEVDLSTMYGQAYNSAAMATYSAEVGLNAKIKAAEMKKQANGDANSFVKNYEAYEFEILANAPSPEAKAVAQRRFKAYRETGLNSILQENQVKDKKYQTGTWQKNATSTTTDVINLLNNGTPKEAEESMQAFALQGHALVESGAITEGQRVSQQEKVRSDVQRETHRFAFNRIVNQNVVQAEIEMQHFSEEIPEGMSVATHRAVSADMRSSISTKVKTNKANKKAQLGHNDDIAEKAITVMNAGKIPIDFQSVLELEVSPKMQEKLNTSVTLLGSTINFNAQTIPHQENSLNQLRSKENPTAADVIELNHLNGIHAHNVSMVKKDPIQLAVEKGFIVPPAPVSPNDTSALGNRTDTVRQLSSLFGVEGKFLTVQEEEQFRSAYANGDSVQKVAIVNNIVNAVDGGSASKIFNQIAKKGGSQIRFMGMMVGSGNRTVADIAAKGESVEKSSIPSGFKNELTSYLGNALSHTKDGYNTFYEGGTNYYKGKALISGGEYDIEDSFTESLGEKATYNGKDILLPSGKNKGDFEDHINSLTPDMIPSVNIENKQAFIDQLQGTTDFWVTGKSNDIKYVQKGYGKYGITIKNQNVMQTTEDGDVIPFIMELK